MFEKANRLKLRYDSNVGQLMTEDLWDLPLRGKASLDMIAKRLNKEVKVVDEESFVDAKTKTDSVLELKFEIVKYIISVKLKEERDRKNAAETKEKKERLLGILANREVKEEEEKSTEEIKKLISELT